MNNIILDPTLTTQGAGLQVGVAGKAAITPEMNSEFLALVSQAAESGNPELLKLALADKAGKGSKGEVNDLLSQAEPQMAKNPKALKATIANLKDNPLIPLGPNLSKEEQAKIASFGDDFVGQKNTLKALKGKKDQNEQSSPLSLLKSKISRQKINGYKSIQKSSETNFIQPKGPSKPESMIEEQGLKIGMSDMNLGQAVAQDAGSDNNTSITPKTKVLDISQISSSNKTQIIEKISQYLDQQQLETAGNVDVIVKHDDLGMFKIQASRGKGAEAVNLEIVTTSDEGRAFFQQNEGQLIKSITDSGVKLNDVRLSNSSEFNLSQGDKNNQQDQSLSDKGGQGHKEQGFGQQKHSHQGDRERRRELWQSFKEFSQAA